MMFNYTEIIDISIPLGESTPIFPGDPRLSISMDMQIAQGAVYNFSRVAMAVHTGTHVDAPWHVFDDGEGINQVPLNALVGPTKVYDLTGSDCITASRLADLDIDGSARVLFKTSNADLWKRSETASDYVALTANAADFPVHHILLKNRVAIIEGLNLHHVRAGEYFPICLPLKLSNAKAAPARGVLLR